MEKVALPRNTRQTKYVVAVIDSLEHLSHATNLELLTYIRRAYPEVSATTIHRITTRLKARNSIAVAPSAQDGSERYDVTSSPHHHFLCLKCGRICDVPDTEEASRAVSKLKELSGQCAIAGTLTMQGICNKCI